MSSPNFEDLIEYTKRILSSPEEMKKYLELMKETNKYMEKKVNELKEKKAKEKEEDTELTEEEKKKITLDVIKELEEEEENKSN